MLFTCIKSWFFRNHLANFHQISHWSFCCNVIDSLFKWSCSIDCQAHIFFLKTKNCSNDDIFISCDVRIGKMLHNICMSAVAMSLRWTNRGPWASCFYFYFFFFSQKICFKRQSNVRTYFLRKNFIVQIITKKYIIQWNLVISNSLISNCRLSQSENLVPVLTWIYDNG